MDGEVERAAKRAHVEVVEGTGEAVEVEKLRSAAVLEGAGEEEGGDRPPGFGKESGGTVLPETPEGIAVEMGMGEAFTPVGGGETPRFSLGGSEPAASDGFAGSPAVVSGDRKRAGRCIHSLAVSQSHNLLLMWTQAYAGGLDFLGDSGAAGGEDMAEATPETDPGWSVRSR